MGGVAMYNHLKVGENYKRNDNIKISVKVGENNICKIQLFQCAVRADVWPVLYEPTLILFLRINPNTISTNQP